ECVIIFGIHDTTSANPVAGDFFVVDELSFSAVSGLDALSALSSNVHVYPNPATDFVTLETGSGPEQSEIFIYNMHGQTVKHFPTRNIAANHTMTLSTADLPAGIYRVQIISGNRQRQSKFVKQ